MMMPVNGSSVTTSSSSTSSPSYSSSFSSATTGTESTLTWTLTSELNNSSIEHINVNISHMFHAYEMNISSSLNETCSDVKGIFQSYNFTEYNFPNPESVISRLSWFQYCKILVCVLVMFVIVIGNGSVIIAVAINKTLRTTINYYLCNLAVADVLICAFCLWVNLVNHITEPLYILGPFMCKFNAFTQMTCLTSSVLTLSAISCDRFMAIHFPLRARVTKQRTALILSLIWTISVVVSVPFLIFRKHYVIQWNDFVETNCIENWPSNRYLDERGKCITSYPGKHIYYTLVTVMLFFIPVFVMICSYSMIVWRLWYREVPGESYVSTSNGQQGAQAAQSTKKVIKLVCMVLIIFVICWMPLQLMILYSLYGHSPHAHGTLPKWFSSLTYICSFIAYSNSAINPFIYGGFNKNFREALYSLLRCKCSQPNRPNSIQRYETAMSLKTVRTVNCANVICKTPMVAYIDTNMPS